MHMVAELCCALLAHGLQMLLPLLILLMPLLLIVMLLAAAGIAAVVGVTCIDSAGAAAVAACLYRLCDAAAAARLLLQLQHMLIHGLHDRFDTGVIGGVIEMDGFRDTMSLPRKVKGVADDADTADKLGSVHLHRAAQFCVELR